MSRFAILGADGMLGRTFREVLAARALPFDALTRRELDVHDAGSIRRALDARYDVILNCTAYTDVDGAEANEAAAFATNATAVAALAARAQETGALLVHPSTDYVFDGNASRPYRVDEPRAPLNAYGRSKAAGEEAIERSGAAHLVLRTSWLYAPWSRNFVRTIAAASRARPTLRVVDDQRGRPTATQTFVDTTLTLIDAEARGTFHVTDGGECTWFDLARAVARVTSPSCVVEPCTSDEFPRPAKRPAYSVLDLERTEAVLGRAQPDWQRSLASVLAHFE